jgi:hypothetical protein
MAGSVSLSRELRIANCEPRIRSLAERLIEIGDQILGIL